MTNLPDESRMLLRESGEEVYLAPLTWRLFQLLIDNLGKPLPTIYIYNKIWGNVPKQPYVKIVSAYIYELRTKLKGTIWYISSRHGSGFCSYTLQIYDKYR